MTEDRWMLVCLLVVYSQGDVFARVSASRSTLMLRGIDYRASTDWITMEADELLSVNDIYRACDQRSVHVTRIDGKPSVQRRRIRYAKQISARHVWSLEQRHAVTLPMKIVLGADRC